MSPSRVRAAREAAPGEVGGQTPCQPRPHPPQRPVDSSHTGRRLPGSRARPSTPRGSAVRITAVKWAVAVAALVAPLGVGLTPAGAETRTGFASDPVDGTPTVSGVPNSPDIKQVYVVYDSSGTIKLTIDFYNAPANVDRSQNYGFAGNFTIGTASGASPSGYCSTTNGGISGQHHIYSSYLGQTFFDRATVAGFAGYLNFNRSTSADGRQVTISASSGAIANRDYRCFTYKEVARRRSTVSNPNSDYDPSCDCWYVTVTTDCAGTTGMPYGGCSGETLWFDGFKPTPLTTETARAAADQALAETYGARWTSGKNKRLGCEIYTALAPKMRTATSPGSSRTSPATAGTSKSSATDSTSPSQRWT